MMFFSPSTTTTTTTTTKILTFFLALLLLINIVKSSLPTSQERTNLIVLMHGMGDTCCNDLSLGALSKIISENVEKKNKIISIKFGSGTTLSDFISGFYGDAFDLVNQACEQISEAMRDDMEISILGFSQGGVFARAVVETCAKITVKKLITFGSPHSGVWHIPGCDKNAKSTFCSLSQKAASMAAYDPLLKRKSIQAAYYKDVSSEAAYNKYLNSGSLLSVINEDDETNKEDKNMRKERMCALKMFAMFSFENDDVVVPRDSAIFSDVPRIPFEYTKFKISELLKVRKTEFYRENKLCLRELDERLNLITDVVPNAKHMQFTLKWFKEHIIEGLLVDEDDIKTNGVLKIE
jgi:palmitoyl-protein thioesterase